MNITESTERHPEILALFRPHPERDIHRPAASDDTFRGVLDGPGGPSPNLKATDWRDAPEDASECAEK